MTRPAVGVVGASARAAAMSLVRAGFAPWAVDLFADRDLRRIAPVARCPFANYPQALPGLCDAFPPGPVLYTGGLENHPAVVAGLAARRELWGNGPAVLAVVRDPFRLAELLRAKGFAVPRLLPATDPLPTSGRWLRKSLHSAGGLGVRFADSADESSPDVYFQQFIDGVSMSALFDTQGAKTQLLGVTVQLVGEPWLHARPFRYAGNVGPVAVSAGLTSRLTLLGYRLQTAAGVRGLWGVDFVLAGGEPWVVEVNPRYTAGLEVIELATGVAAAGSSPPPLWGRSPRSGGWGGGVGAPGELVGGGKALPPTRPSADLPHKGGGEDGPSTARTPPFPASGGGSVVGKAIYFAPHRVVFPPAGPWDADLAGDFDPWRVPGFADIPEPGEVVEPGWPVLTFFATGSTPAECRHRLQSRAAELDRLFAAPPASRGP